VPSADATKGEWRDRRQRYQDHLRTATADALLVSGADKLHNARTIVADLRAGFEVFSRFKGRKEGTLWYYSELLAIFTERLGEDHPLVIEYTATVAAMRSESREERAAA
jgi:hypothetical protein